MSNEREQRLNEIVTRYLEGVQAGQPPNKEEILSRHTDLAKELTSFFSKQDEQQTTEAPTQMFTGEAPPTSSTDPVAASDASPRTFGDYELLEEIARGGMGVVYKARQAGTQRLVALKIIRADRLGDLTEEERQSWLNRFRWEAEAVARLDHPHIVPLYQFGEWEGQPYFSMKLIAGQGLASQAARFRDDPQSAARLLARVARAVHHAHQRQLLHRDLKPANILLDAEGQPHLTDFGLARPTGARQRGLSSAGAILGTPEYMAPEQARAEPNLTTAVDVYGLGAILYELLTGRPPFRAATPLDVLLQILERDPEPPRQLVPDVDRDLETICLKCLHKELPKRYGSAEALAEDLERWQRGEPIQARPAGRVERLWRWCRRNAAVATLAMILLVVLLGGAGISLFFAVQANARAAEERSAREDAGRELARAESNLYFANVNLANREAAAANVGRVNQLLDECPAELRGWEWYFLRRTYRRELFSIPAPVNESCAALAYSPEGGRLALLCLDHSVRIHDAATGRPLHTLPPLRAVDQGDGWQGGGRNDHNYSCVVAYNRDGDCLATVCNNRTFHIRDANTGKQLAECRGHDRWVTDITFNRDGNWVASAGFDRNVLLWDTATGKEVRRWKEATAVAFHPDGRWIATCHNEKNTVSLWDAATGRELRTFQDGEGHDRVVFHPNGKLLAALSSELRHDATVSIWDVATGKKVRILSQKIWLGPGRALRYSPDGRRLAMGGIDNDLFGGLTVWELATGKAIRGTRSHREGGVLDVAFDPSGRRLAAVHEDRESSRVVRVWATRTGLEAARYGEPDMRAGYWHTGSLEASGRLLGLATAENEKNEKTSRLWDVEHRAPLLLLPAHLERETAAAICPQTRRIAAHSRDGMTTVWDGHTGKQIVQFAASPPSWVGHIAPVRGVCFGAGGQLATWCLDQFIKEQGRIKLWDIESGRLLHDLDGNTDYLFSVAFDPEGRRLAAVGNNGRINLWDTATGEKIWSAAVGGIGLSVAFSADGKLVAADASVRLSGEGSKVKIFDAETGEENRTLSGLVGNVTRIAFSPDRSRLVTADEERLRVWNASNGQELLALPCPERVHGLTYTPDGYRLIVIAGEHIQIFDGTPLGRGEED